MVHIQRKGEKMGKVTYAIPYMLITGCLAMMTPFVDAAPKKKPAPAKLTPAGETALAEYTEMLDSLRAGLKKKLPALDNAKEAAFKSAYDEEKEGVRELKDRKGNILKDKNGKVRTQKVKGGYHNPKTSQASVDAAKAILADIDTFLSSDALDKHLVKCAVLSDATPLGLALFAQKGTAEKKQVDELLADPDLMKKMLIAGGAKGGHYAKSIEIYNAILAKYPKAKEGVFHRIALALALEMAAPELCGYGDIDPIKRYAFYETSYLDKSLDSHFDKHSIWMLRHVVNDPQTEEDMLWMREMLWNYRPDHITACENYPARYVGLMHSEFGHKRPEFDEKLPTTRLQQTIDKGGQCGPKAFFGRCLGRSFGVPVWGARLRSHTAMTYWMPKGWTQILGVSFANGFWTVDQVDPMLGRVFLLHAGSRKDPSESMKVCRAQWVGTVFGEEKFHGREAGKGGLWNALALCKMRIIVADKGSAEAPQAPLKPGEKKVELKGYPERLERLEAPAELKKVTVGGNGSLTVPAVSCTTPTKSTDKIVFMKTRDGGMNLHYKRWELPESLVYEVDAPKAGAYALAMQVVTVNRDQFFMLTVNDAKEPIKVQMPYTVGKWGESKPVTVPLKAGKNTLTFFRTAPGEFKKDGWKFAGPEYGGITIKSIVLNPVQ